MWWNPSRISACSGFLRGKLADLPRTLYYISKIITLAVNWRASGGIGRRARFRAVWDHSREGSTPSPPTNWLEVFSFLRRMFKRCGTRTVQGYKQFRQMAVFSLSISTTHVKLIMDLAIVDITYPMSLWGAKGLYLWQRSNLPCENSDCHAIFKLIRQLADLKLLAITAFN